MRLPLLVIAALFAALPAAAQYEAYLFADIRLGNTSSNPSNMIEYDGQLFFVAYNESHRLWTYDTATDEISSVWNAVIAEGGVRYDNRLFFNADAGGLPGYELYAYSAAEEGAVLVADINPGMHSTLPISGSYPSSFEVYDDRLFFKADDGEHGKELWVYDDATDEATLVADINSGSVGSNPSALTVYDGRLFFASGGGLWNYDAASQEVALVEENIGLPLSMQVYDGRLFFRGSDGEHGKELWAYDAATDEAVLIADINPGPVGSDGAPNPGGFKVYDDRLFFLADNGDSGSELWAYSAATDDVSLITDVNPGDSGSYPGFFEVYDGRLFFSATVAAPADEFWFYDSDTDEVSRAVDSNTYSTTFFTSVASYDGRLFFGADDGTHGRELWALSPTPVANEPSAAPQPARLHAPHPNPARSEATVTFDVAEAGPVRVEVLDVLGRRVALLADGPVAAGEHTLRWEAAGLSSGLYLVRLMAGNTVQTQRLTLMR